MISAKSFQGKTILFATIVASGMAFLQGGVVSIALPTIQNYFNANIQDLQWLINGFLLVLSAFIMTGGLLGDHYGRKKVFVWGILIFTIGSVLSAFSQTLLQLILYQVLSGVGAALMIPGSLAIINSAFASNEKGSAIGLWAGFSGGIAAVGPFAGGFLIDLFGWRSVFVLPIPFALLALFSAIRYVPESYDKKARSIDWEGAIIIAAALFTLAFGLIQGPALGWMHGYVILSLIIGVVLLLFFISHQHFAKEPSFPPEIFRRPLVLGANLATLGIYFALNGVIIFLVLNLQQVQEYTPTQAGLALVPTIAIITFLSGPFGSLADKWGPRFQMIVGPIGVGIAMLLLSFAGTTTSYFVHFFPGLILLGLSMAFVIAPLTKSALSVPSRYSGVASGVNNAISRIAALLAVAVMGAVIATGFSIALDDELSSSSLSSEIRDAMVEQRQELAGMQVEASGPDSAEVDRIVKHSFLEGFRVALYISATLAFLSAVVSFFTIKK